MSHQMMTRKVTLFIVLLIFLAFVASDISHGNPNTLAQKVYNKHTKTLTRADVLTVLPDVLKKLKTPKVQRLLNDRSIKLIVNNPDLLKTFLPDVSDKFITLLKTDAQFKKLIRDADFQKVLQNPAAINALVVLMTDRMPPQESLVVFDQYYATTSTPALTGGKLRVKLTGLRLGSKYPAGSTHKIIVTVTKAESHKPAPSIRLSLSSKPTSTFRPAVITTDKNGEAETQITLPKQPGSEVKIRVDMDMKITEPEVSWVSFKEFSYDTILNGERFGVRFTGLRPGSKYRAGSKHKVILTLINGRTGKPVPSARLSLSYNKKLPATATFRPATLTTDKNGTAETLITLGKKPGNLGISAVVLKLEEPQVTFGSVIFSGILVDGDGVDLDTKGWLSSNIAQSPGSKHKVTFILTNERTGKPVPSARLRLSIDSSSTTTATFKPATITTDKNGTAETQITFGKKPGRLSMSVKMEKIDHATTRVVFDGMAYTAYVDRKEVDLKRNLTSTTGYRPGSKHKLILTLTNKQTRKPLPSTRLNLRVHRDSTTTATFRPATITTDKNGKAETQITFGKKPGNLSIAVDIRASRKVDFYTTGPRLSGGAGIDIDITLDGASGKLSEFSDFSHPLGLTKTRKKLVVKTKSAGQPAKSVPYVDLIFNDVSRQSKGSVTFAPKKVRTDKNGHAVTYITLRAGQTDVSIEVKVNMVLVMVNLNPDPYSPVRSSLYDHPYDSLTRHLDQIKIYVNGKRVLGYLLRKAQHPADHEKFRVPEVLENFFPIRGGPFTTGFEGILPLNAKVYLQAKISPGALYTISGKDHADLKLNQGYATSDKNGLIKIGMNTGSKSGVSKINLNPLKNAQLKGTVRIYGVDDDTFVDDYFKDKLDLPPININSQTKFKWRHTLTYRKQDKTLDGMRVEIEIKTGRILSGGVETGVFARLYEGTSAKTDDLEDVNVGSFITPWVSPSAYASPEVWRNLTTENIQNPSDRPALYLINVATFNQQGIRQTDKLVREFGRNFFLHTGRGAYSNLLDLAEYIGIDLSDWQEFPDEFGGDRVIVVFDLQLAPINWTPVFGAPAAVTPNLFSLSDVNGDGKVDAADLVWVSNYLGQTGSIDPRVDVNRDGIVTIADLVWVAQYLSQSTSSTAPAAVVVPAGLQYSTVAGWIDQARVEDDGSLVFHQGIAKLEYLLTLIIPEETALLTNYPNPFNPETWIPYHLTTPADVTLTIYAIDGKVVRRLDLGHQAAGYYQSKARAAYWDGRNTVGERVASGIYFYTLTAGDFAATGKMLIMK